jgi:hypothetical protein
MKGLHLRLGLAGVFVFSVIGNAAAQTARPYVEAIRLETALYDRTPNPSVLQSDARLDARTAATLKDNARIFELLGQGAAMDSTDWGIGDGLDLKRVMPQLNGVRSLVNLSILRARWEWKNADFGAGEEDLLNAMALERHMTHDHPMLIVELVHIGSEASILTNWAKLLPAEPRDQLALLPEKLKELPEAAGAADMVRAEHRYASAAPTYVPPGAIVAMASFYDAAAQIVGQDPPPTVEDLKKELSDAAGRVDDPVGRQLAQKLAPSFASGCNNFAVVRAYDEMFSTGIAILRDGPEAVGKSSDPYGTGPFGYAKTAGGFELSSKLISRGKAVKLDFGE